jgi:hypothetical protein
MYQYKTELGHNSVRLPAHKYIRCDAERAEELIQKLLEAKRDKGLRARVGVRERTVLEVGCRSYEQFNYIKGQLKAAGLYGRELDWPLGHWEMH